MLGFAWSVLGSEARAIMGVLNEEPNRTEFRKSKTTPAADDTEVEQVVGNLVAFGRITAAFMSPNWQLKVEDGSVNSHRYFISSSSNEAKELLFPFYLHLKK